MIYEKKWRIYIFLVIVNFMSTFLFINNVSANEKNTIELEVINQYELLSGSVTISQETTENFFKRVDSQNINLLNQTVSLNYDLIENNTIYTIDIEYLLRATSNNLQSGIIKYYDRKLMTGSELKSLNSLSWNNQVKMFYPSEKWLEEKSQNEYVNMAFYSSIMYLSSREPILVSPKAVKGILYYGERDGKYYLLVKESISVNESEGFSFEKEMLETVKLEFDSATRYDKIKFDTYTGAYFLETIDYVNQLYISPRNYTVSLMNNKEDGQGYQEIYKTGQFPILKNTVLRSPANTNIEVTNIYYKPSEKTLDIYTEISRGDFNTSPIELNQKMLIRVLKDDKLIIQDSSQHPFAMLKNVQLDSGTYTVEITLDNLSTSKNFIVTSNDPGSNINWSKWEEEPLTNDPLKKWTIQLSSNIDPMTINNQNVYIQNAAGKINSKVEMGNEPNIIVVHAPENGYRNGDYSLYIKDLKSIDQIELSKPIIMNFTVNNSSNNITSMFDFFYPGFDWTSELSSLVTFVEGNLIYEMKDYIGIDIEDRFGYKETLWGSLSSDGKKINEIYITFDEHEYYSEEKLNLIYNDLLSKITQLTGMKPVTAGNSNSSDYYAEWKDVGYTGRLYLSVKNKEDIKMSSIVLYIYN